ncbi:MAG: 16S rRNA (cytidine(1402)-2'-O)-methyltransferase [Anaerolineae bacterium]
MGTLYVVATPIGHLEDITFRAVRILDEVSLIAAEDTRKAHILLERYEITTPVTSFFEGNERRKQEDLLEALSRGDVALISEAGTPTLSDPGYPLVRAAIERGFPVTPVPGPSAHTAALVASGLPTDRFLFLGFLPRQANERAALLEKVARLQVTLILYESPRRVEETVAALRAALGNRPVALCRELTKLHEEIWRGDLAGALAHLRAHPPRGEFTLVVGGATDAELRWDEARVRTALSEAMARGLSHSQAAREVAKQSGWNRSDVYDLKT